VLVGAFLVPILLYYASRLILNPTPVNVEIILSNPASGFYMTRDSELGNARTSKSLLRELSSNASVQWVSAGGEGLILDWASGAQEVTFDAQISLISGCVSSGKNLENHWPPHKIFRRLKKLEILVDEGFANLNLNTVRKAAGTFMVHMDESMFWIDQDPENKKIKVTHFTDEEARLEFVPSSSEIIGSLSLPLFETKDNWANPVSRNLTIIVDGQPTKVTVLPPSMLSNETIQSECVQLADASDWTKPLRADGPQLKVILTITEHVQKEGRTPVRRLRFTAKRGMAGSL
jgi:hypothetical protein